jgi:hypothetical protein
MKLIPILILATMSCAYAADELAEFIDPTHPSKDEMATIHVNGRSGPIHIRTFGTDKIAQAREFGLSIGNPPDKEAIIWAHAAALYPHDRFFQKAFVQYAR